MARDFDGTADYLLSSISPVTALPVTLACWLQSDQNSADQVVMSIGNSGADNRVAINYSGTGTDDIQAASVTAAAAVGSALSGTAPANGTWMHAAAVFVNSASRFAYLDGVSGAENTTSRDADSATWDYVAIAARNSSSVGGFFNGKVAEAAIWNVALTSGEVEQLAAGFSPLMVRPEALVFYAPLHGRNGASGDEEDWVGGITMAQTSSPALFDHPRIIYPRRRIWVPVTAAGGTSTNLVIADASHAHAADNLALTLDTTLVTADASHAHAAEGLALTTASSLSVDDAAHGHAADSLGLTLDTTLAVDETSHAHTADNLTLEVAGATNLTIADATHGHAADAPMVYTDWLLSVADAAHAHSADSPELTDAPVLAIAEATHAHAADSFALMLDTWLTVADALHAHTADSPVVTSSTDAAIRHIITARGIARRITGGTRTRVVDAE